MKYSFKFDITSEFSISTINYLRAVFNELQANFGINCDLRIGQENRIVIEGCDDVLEHHDTEVNTSCTFIKKYVYEYQPDDEMECLHRIDALLVFTLDNKLGIKSKIIDSTGEILETGF